MRPSAARLVSISFLLALPAALAAQTLGGAPATQAQIAALQQQVRSAQSAGDNAWMLISSALVLLMTGPGLLRLVDKTIGLRLSATDEHIGLDLSQHGEEGYEFNS